jgi:glycosyltransferase involved in cell wall biosynthesis
MYAIFSSVLTFGKVGVVHTQHSLPQSEDTLRYRMYRRLFSLGIHKLSVVSPHIQDSYARFLFTSTRIHLIENGVEFLDRPVVDRCQKRTVRCSLFDGLSVDHRERLRRYTDDLWVIYQARFSPGKGQEHALALWKSMRTEDRQRCILCMVGPEAVAGAHQRVESSTQDCPDHDRIFIIPGSDTPLRWLSASDLFLSCSEYEGMPLAPLEAAGSGLPLLLSRIPGHAFLNEYSLQFSLDDIQQGANHMASLFSRILDGGTLYQGQLWQKGNSLRQTFSVSAMAHKYAQLYHTA